MQSIQLKNTNKQFIKCSLYHAADPGTVVVFVPAMGVLQSFYKEAAQFFQANGISAITFDYSGIGNSLYGDIRKESCDLKSWGNSDLEAVLQFSMDHYPNQKRILLGHSLGGQLIGLAPSSTLADKIILVAAQSGYWKFWKGSDQASMWTNWNLLFPVLPRIFGYMPTRKFTRMENLPSKVAVEWAKWCRNKNYLFACVDEDKLSFRKIMCPITSISIDDDFFAPKEAVDWLSSKYVSAATRRLHLIPKDFNVPAIGHFSLFRQQFKSTVWELLLQEIST